MRFKEIEKLLSIVDFNHVTLDIDNTGTSSPRLKNIKAFKLFIEIVGKTSIYDDEIDILKQSMLYQTSQDSLVVTNDVGVDIYRRSKYLVDSSSALSLVFSKLLPPSSPESIIVKLPEPSDFEALVKTMSVLQTSISQVIVHKEIDGSIKINSWEFGSFWLDLFLGTSAAVSVVSSIAWSAAVISKKFNEDKILEATVRAMEIKNESLEDILESQKALTRQLIDNETKSVIDEHFTESDPEHSKRVEFSIKTLAKLIQEGAQVHPSLLAPEEVSNLFPNYKKLDSITSKIKQLEDLSDGTEESPSYD